MAHPLASVKNFTYNTLNKELELDTSERKNLEELLLAYLDDFWQKGAGSLLPPATGTNGAQITTFLEKRFVFRNIIKEVTGRVVGAFFGKAPNWKFQVAGQDLVKPEEKPANTGENTGGTNPPPENVLNDQLIEVDKALNEFFTRQKVSDELGKAFAFRLAFGRGSWRVYLPTKYKRKNTVAAAAADSSGAPTPNTGADTENLPEGDKNDGGEYVQFSSIADAIRAMHIEFVPPTQGRLLDDGGEYFSVVRYTTRHNWETRDVVNIIEFSFVDNNDLTFIGTIGEKSGISNLQEANLSTGLNLGGRTTLGQFRGEPYVTPALYKNNQLLNLALTCAGFSLVDNGFGEMVLTNVDLATKKVMGPDGEMVEVPEDIKRGGGVVQNLIGIQQVDDKTGAATRLTPGVTFKDPTPMTAFKDGYDLAYLACLQEAGQMYALISGDATASGESRIQALADFILKIRPYKAEVDEQGTWLMTVVLLLGAALSGESFDGYTVVYDSRMFVAALSDTEKQTVMTMREKGTISRETERVLLGIDDPALEEELVLREQNEPPGDSTVDQFSTKLDAALKMVGVSIPQETIMKFLGYTDADIQKMNDQADQANKRLAEEIRIQTEAGTPPGGPPAPGQGGSNAGAAGAGGA